MKLEQKQSLTQKLVLTQTMRQSLDCLQLSAPELEKYVDEIALSNPLLDVEPPTWYETSLPNESPDDVHEPSELRIGGSWSSTLAPAKDFGDLNTCLTKESTFRDYLNEQIGQMRFIDNRQLSLCRFLIGCLDERGYLDCPIAELSTEICCSQFELEQALFAIQMLDPPGVGSRSLSECLTLQLAQGSAFNSLTLAIVRDGLELLGKREYNELAHLLGVSVSSARQAAEAVLELNPIPTRGFAGTNPIVYTAPDALFHSEQGRLIIELNDRILPKLSINAEYSALLNNSCDSEVQHYVREKVAEAQALIKGVDTRCSTLLRMLTRLGDIQRDFFLYDGDLVPITMQQLAEQLDVNTSTISRAVQGKSIQFQGQILPIRSLFTTAICTDTTISAQTVKQRIRALTKNEDSASPLSDEELRIELSQIGIAVSRRTIAKYRTAMGIPSSSQRRAR